MSNLCFKVSLVLVAASVPLALTHAQYFFIPGERCGTETPFKSEPSREQPRCIVTEDRDAFAGWIRGCFENQDQYESTCKGWLREKKLTDNAAWNSFAVGTMGGHDDIHGPRFAHDGAVAERLSDPNNPGIKLALMFVTDLHAGSWLQITLTDGTLAVTRLVLHLRPAGCCPRDTHHIEARVGPEDTSGLPRGMLAVNEVCHPGDDADDEEKEYPCPYPLLGPHVTLQKTSASQPYPPATAPRWTVTINEVEVYVARY